MATVERQTTSRPVPQRRPAQSPPKKSAPRQESNGDGFMGMGAINLLVHGPPGVGKTSFMANFPKPGFFHDPQEQGINVLVRFRRCPKPVVSKEVDNWDALMTQCRKIIKGDYPIETACFDSLTGLEKLCFLHHCQKYFDGDWSKEGFFAYQQGPKNAAKTDWPEFIQLLQDINGAGINVILAAHSQVKAFNNPEGKDYDRYIPYMDKETWQAISRWTNAVLFYKFEVELDKKGLKAKTKLDTEHRLICAERTAAYDAKNWWGLDPYIQAGESGKEAYDAFAEAFGRAAKGP